MIRISKIDNEFVEIVEDLFNAKNLSNLHLLPFAERYDQLFEVGADSSTIFHKRFYDKYREGWPAMQHQYRRLIEGISRTHANFVYQKFPTFRVHLPNNVAVGAFHKDRDFNHPHGEINFIIPLTNSYDTASVWIESEEDKGDFSPMPMKIDGLICFDGNNLTHGNKVNETGKTRVSMDFRILPLACYKESQFDFKSNRSLTTNTKFTIGEYYTLYKD